jgi:nitroreductase
MISSLKLLLISLFFLLALTNCQQQTFNEKDLKNYHKTVHESFHHHEGRREKVIPTGENKTDKMKIPEDKNWVCLLHWSSEDCDTLKKYNKTDRHHWGTLCSEVLDFLKGNNIKDPEKRLIQKFGLRPEDLGQKKCFFMFYTNPDSTFRSSVERKEENEEKEKKEKPKEHDEKEKEQPNLEEIRIKYNFPFSSLGYTCDWSKGYCSYGFSEYIIKGDTDIEIKELLSTKDFLEKYFKAASMKKIPEIEKRFSVNSYDERVREIPEKAYKVLFESISLAPSAWNLQNYKFIVVKKNSKVFNLLLDTLNSENRKILENASSIIVFVNKKISSEKEKYTMIDIGIATGFFLIQAENLGLKTHIIGEFDTNKVNEILKIPNDYEVQIFSGLGYSKDHFKKRTRKPLNELFTFDNFNSPYKLDL